ncbi:PREDICTED: uncharacterized protein LOC109347116 [Lupinus angustifolius]|uniref:uncharacterized protein LOC109347116 n=1 Tax=Lupinus angustifolius TaxID=3871 RepID=UPI00092F3822|nr:PREDICTED: uncharacterized protein LOC109347116 [Lupinus angustifolius]
MNGAVEAANKNIKWIVQKMVVTYKGWHKMLPFALHGYRTSVCISTGATPYSLVYGMKVVLPLEVEVPSLRVLAEAEENDDGLCKEGSATLVQGRRFGAKEDLANPEGQPRKLHSKL